MNGLKNVKARHHDALTRVAWDQFEVLLAGHYRKEGFHVEHVGTGATGKRFDGGIDLKLRRDDEFILVQCKHWNAKQVPHNDVHQLIGIMVNEGATGAILVTSGEFTRYAIESATKQGHVQLIDGGQLRAMIGPLPDLPEPPQLASSRSSAESWQRAIRARSRGRNQYPNPLARIVVGLAVLFLFVFALRFIVGHALQRMHNTLVPVRAPAATMQKFVPPQAPQPLARIPTPLTPSMTAPTRSPPQADSAAAMSAAEAKEWQRKNAEAMKILEKTTPEAQ